MTTVSYTRDKRYLVPNGLGGTTLIGEVEARNTVGGDRTLAERQAGLFLDHSYSGTRSQKIWGLYKYEIFNGATRTHLSFSNLNDPASLFACGAVSWSSNDELVLLGRLAKKYRQHDWHAGIFIGELGKTTDTLAGRAKQIGQSLLLVKRGRFREAVSVLGAKPNNRALNKARAWANPKNPHTNPDRYGRANWYGSWLELRYAWRPLLNDIYELSEAIRTLDVPRAKILRASFSKPRPVTVEGHCKVTGEGKLLMSLKATLSESPPSLVAHLGLNNPESVAWELMPWSFVIDWFIPIGNYLATRNTLSKMTAKYVRTEYLWQRLTLTRYYDTGGNPGVGVWSRTESVPGTLHAYRSMSINRSLPATLSVPLPVFRNPVGSNPATRLLDAVALIASAVKR